MPNPQPKRFLGHTSGINAVAFSPDGKHFVSGGWDRTARLWNIDTDGIENRVYSYYLDELWEAGVQLEPEDLKKIGKTENKR